MKYAYKALLLLLSISTCLTIEAEDFKPALFGPVKLVRTEERNETSNFHLTEILKLDESGRVVEQEKFPPQAQLISKTDFQYDSKGRLNETTITFPNSPRSSVSIRRVYNADGTLEEAFEYDGNGKTKEQIKYKYDPSGRLQEEASYLSDGSQRFRRAYKYDEQGRLIDELHFGSEGIVEIKKQYAYGVDSKPEVIRQYGSNGLLRGKSAIKWDQSGNKVQVRNFDSANQEESVIAYSYDSRDNIIEESRYEEKRLIQRKVHEYEYDSAGNWILMRSFNCTAASGKDSCSPSSVTKRKITYYPASS